MVKNWGQFVVGTFFQYIKQTEAKQSLGHTFPYFFQVDS
jgi:hypothetical protein